MEVIHTKKLVLTEAEQKVIHNLYEILNGDSSLNVYDVWDILEDIYQGNNNSILNYDIEITD